jgi:hypothetical protein
MLFVGRASSHDFLPLGEEALKSNVSRSAGKTSRRNVVAHPKVDYAIDPLIFCAVA